MTLGEIARAVEGELCRGNPDLRVRAVSIDSRTLSGGELFFALRGQRHDGHAFAARAVAAGAAGVVVEREVPDLPPGAAVIRVRDTLCALQQLARYHREAFKIPVIGVTGSSGKTTTKDLVAAVLARRFKTLKTTANRNNEIGLPLTLLELAEGHEALVVEMAMRGPGEIAFLCRLARPNGAVITNIGEAHLERLGSVDRIARAKGEILEAVPPDGFAFLHRDSPYIRREASRCRGRVYYFGLDGEADVLAENLRAVQGGCRFYLRLPSGEGGEVFLPLLGRHNVENALAAAGVGWALGVPFADIAAGLAGAELTPMRLEVVEFPGAGVKVINDAYNANPASTRAALSVLAEVGAGRRRIAVLGDMLELGEAGPESHRQIGSLAAGVADYLVAVGDLAVHYVRGALEAGMPAGRAAHFASRGEAAAFLKEVIRPGDVVLVKGSRGMRMEEIYEEVRRHLQVGNDG
ncbi:UDP-N-acetylmuramoyl-tripeptide--D-alanyl-D-alanine ligase [Desulfovirgula thermocuniculi]|uniref:UDP-N-acetylmuramoyl-tripeptide--D-alanyl-D- alanine ligase n=1 Tax=Desulfovirgula thermocuniculi TaxID=348842 RepID=UPI0003FB314D|nr:UDP-N-acetylmuramoyl-tripeptide--D-alanyl-D-alanine ligase [Desulfovirgula thermocuniculi]